MVSLEKQIAWSKRIQSMLVGGMLLAATTFYLLAYRTQTARLVSLNRQISITRSDLANCKAQTRILSSVRTDVERLKVRLREVKTLPGQMDVPQFIKDLAQIQQMASLRNFDHKSLETEHGDRLDQMPITIRFEGDFTNVFSFLRHAEDLPRLTRVPKINVRRNLQGQSDKPGQVKVEMTMDIYSLAE